MNAEQLALPQIDPYPDTAASVLRLPHARRVWVNRSLRMSRIEWVGFDMDYTLAIYRQTEIDKLSIRATVKKLVERGYPPELADVEYPYDFPVRGLLIDKRYGHMLKMNRYKYVGRAFHGTRELGSEERRALYHSRRVRPSAPRYHWIDTLYALPEAALYAGAVDLLDRYGTAVDYAQLFQDIRECIDEAHRDGAIVDVIQHALPQFVEKDPDLAGTLHKLRSAGKKLFLLTNSRWGYSDAMMSYLLDGQMSEYPSWRNYFDLVVVAATKPAFFTERRPFLERVGDGTAPASQLERGHVYENGNLKDFERMIRSGGDSVLYVGDHIYGDILRSKKDTAWRTVMVVQEMEQESHAHESMRDERFELESLGQRRERLEDELRYRQARFKSLSRTLEEQDLPRVLIESDDPVATAGTDLVAVAHERLREKRAIERIRAALKELEDRAARLSVTVDAAFHPYWGSIFKLGNELSSFGDQVEDYACLYTSRVSNLLTYSPTHYFHSGGNLMPHEIT